MIALNGAEAQETNARPSEYDAPVQSHANDALSPFAETGTTLIANGYSPLPIRPSGKAPGEYSGGEWRGMLQWERFCAEPARPNFIAHWGRMPGAGVGVALGLGLIAVDIDLDPAVDSVTAALPPSIVSKRGAKGLTLFFRGDTTKIASRAFRIEGVGAVDLLSHGKQSVLPPSIHPKTGRPYEWQSFRTLLDTPLAELTEAPDDIADLIAKALRPFGYNAEQCFEWDGAVRDSESQSTDYFRRLNEDALVNLDAWVPKLGLPKAHRKLDGSWRAVPCWRPSSTGQADGKRKPNLSFDQRGIRDFGEEKGYTPLNAVMAALGLDDDLDRAATWLAEALGHRSEPVISLVAGPSAPSRLAVSHAAVPDEEPDEEAEAFEAPTTLEDLSTPPGLVGEIVEWIVSTAERPSRAVALGPALGFVATLAGRQFASPSDARTNLYFATLAPSGYGKDRPREAIKRLAQAAALKAYLGAGRLMSTTALRNALMRQPTCLFMIDEFHGNLRMMLDKKSAYGQLLGTDLMEVFASAATFFSGAEYANAPAIDIQNPNLSVYGTSTQDAFWASIQSVSALDGLLARMLLFNIDGAKPAEVEPSASVRDVPPALVAKCQAIASARGNLANVHDGAVGVEATQVPYGDGAAARLREFKRLIEQKEGAADQRQLPFLNRAAEHAIKLALTVAVGCDPVAPAITGAIMEWACRLSWHSTCSMISEIQSRVADGQREADFNRILGLIKKAGPSGITIGKIVDQTRNVEERRRNELLRDLQAAGRVRAVMVQTQRGSRERWTFVR